MGATEGLFRSEAVAARADRLGTPVRAFGLASWALTLFLAALAIAVSVFLGIATYARKETVTGVLTPAAGSVRIAAVQPGIVADVHVREGQHVEAGAPVLTLSLDRTTTTGASVGTLLTGASDAESSAAGRQAQARAAAAAGHAAELDARRAGLTEDLTRLADDAALQAQRVALAEQTVEAARTLYDKQLMAALPFRQREEALLAARQALNAIGRERARAESQLHQLAAEALRARAEAAEGVAAAETVQAQFTGRRVQLAAEAGLTLTARRPGRIAALQARAGAPVQPGATLAVILPETGGLEAELWVPSRAIGFIRPGDEVRLMYDAFPYQRFGVGRGVVREVGATPVQPRDLPVPIETKESLYRVSVRLLRQDVTAYDRIWPLAPGGKVTADLILDRRSLWGWRSDPIEAVQRRNS